MPTLLITGATGLLGSNLIRQAVGSYAVIGWAQSAANISAGCAVEYFDLTHTDLTLERLRELRPDVIVHCAAMTDVEQCEREPKIARAINVDATRTLAQWSAQHGAHFVFISTDSVFDGRCGHYGEDDEPAPINEYARTKLAAEKVARECHSDALILRTTFYGWSAGRKASLGEWMFKTLVRREPLAAFPDVRFNPLLVNDLARIILDMIARQAAGLFQAAARSECSKYEFALLIAEMFGFGAHEVRPTSVEDFGFHARRPKNTTLAVDKITQFLDREMPSVEEGLRSFKALLDNGYAAALRGKALAVLVASNAR
ncbi:MAG: SDR family oxidoreductase [Candidatus Acidiferrales bacterium]